MILGIMEEGIGGFVRRVRADQGLSQTALAELASVSKGYLSTLEANKIGLPAPDVRRRLARALGVSHLDLLVAAGEISEDEIGQVGAVGVVERDADPVADELITLVRSVPWASDPDLADGMKRILTRFQRAPSTAPRSTS